MVAPPKRPAKTARGTAERERSVTDSFVHYAAADRIVTLTMNRPDSRNAIGEEAVEAFLEKREPRFTGQ
jgi:hypothetical protein